MDDANTLAYQEVSKTSIGRFPYIDIDGMVKYCITAPLLELPIDFKEWYRPLLGNNSQPRQI